MAVHEGIKFTCRHCNYQATLKSNLAEHKRAVHEGVKYPRRQWNQQAVSKGNLAQHKRAVKERIKKFLVGNATIKQLRSHTLPNTKGQYMKESNTLVGNATIKYHPWVGG